MLLQTLVSNLYAIYAPLSIVQVKGFQGIWHVMRT